MMMAIKVDQFLNIKITLPIPKRTEVTSKRVQVQWLEPNQESFGS